MIATDLAYKDTATDQATIEAAATLATGRSILVLFSITARTFESRANFELSILRHFVCSISRSLEEFVLALCTELRHDYRIPVVV